ncbi:hypothetical protein DFJ73DRAFT_580757 [Zopfochytrium polystomum]|nr:hypothetical protein DFJ73DRAFT_580757 [Zopfochytrium polystomum]
MERRLWPIAGAVALIEFSLHLADAILFNQNLGATFGMIPDPNEQKTSMTLLVYVTSTDTFFFVASQARIVSVMAQVNKVKVSVWHYVDALLRCICYSCAVFLHFVTSGTATPSSYTQSGRKGQARDFRYSSHSQQERGAAV